jgi:hypothetical protein
MSFYLRMDFKTGLVLIFVLVFLGNTTEVYSQEKTIVVIVAKSKKAPNILLKG